jgi:hypothetical protein
MMSSIARLMPFERRSQKGAIRKRKCGKADDQRRHHTYVATNRHRIVQRTPPRIALPIPKLGQCLAVISFASPPLPIYT